MSPSLPLGTEPMPFDGIHVDAQHLLQLRRAAKDISLANRRASRSIKDGSAKSQRKGRGMEFAEVRLYQPGDDIRNIDWRVTARTRQTYTKLFQEEKERPIILVVDQRSNMFFGSQVQFKSALAARLAGVIAWAAFQNRDNIGAFIFNDQKQVDLRPKQGKHALFRFFSTLSETNLQLSTNVTNIDDRHINRLSFSQISKEVQRIARPGSLIYFISDFIDLNNDAVKNIGQLARHSDIELLNLYDPLEQRLPFQHKIALTNGRETTSVHTGNIKFKNQFDKQWQQHISNIEACARSLGLNLHNLSTHSSTETHISTLFNTAKTQRKTGRK